MAEEAIFGLAARALGHDTTTVAGAEAARHDHRVHDLAEQYQREVNDAGRDAELDEVLS